jgi:predicted TIM-barrel fold metal-dependent hydrolase
VVGASGLSETDLAKIYGDNARELLRIEPQLRGKAVTKN